MNFEEEFTTIMQVNHRLPKNVFSSSIFIYFMLISGSLWLTVGYINTQNVEKPVYDSWFWRSMYTLGFRIPQASLDKVISFKSSVFIQERKQTASRFWYWTLEFLINHFNVAIFIRLNLLVLLEHIMANGKSLNLVRKWFFLWTLTVRTLLNLHSDDLNHFRKWWYQAKRSWWKRWSHFIGQVFTRW